jgi:hypothetical protein
VNCGFSREALALHVGGDLPDPEAAAAVGHLEVCAECRRFVEDLRVTQGLLKSARREAASRSDCTAMRHQVMTIVNARQSALGWGLRIERAITLGLRPSYGLAALLLLGMVSVSVLAQIRPPANDAMPRPEGYRQWTGLPSADRVYINLPSYPEYSKTGIFPEGTVLVWEAASEREGARGSAHTDASTLLVSVKDAKFDGGWGFFDFSSTGGTPPAKARALPESRGCRTCHRQGPLSMGV